MASILISFLVGLALGTFIMWFPANLYYRKFYTLQDINEVLVSEKKKVEIRLANILHEEDW